MACRPSTFLPTLDTLLKHSAVGHPRARTKLHPGKGIPNQDDVYQTTRKTLSHVPNRTNNL
jgi:hypothetical protein